jgi:hypothetical protein
MNVKTSDKEQWRLHKKLLLLLMDYKRKPTWEMLNTNEDGLHGDVGGEHEPLGKDSSINGPQDLIFDPNVLLEDAIKELYGGSKCTKLATTMILMNFSSVDKGDKFVDELFTFLRLHLLLVDKCLPNNCYIVKTLTRRLRLDYNYIYACGKGCLISSKI